MDGIYHVYNKSILGFRIFNNNFEFLRMIEMLRYYQHENTQLRFSLLHCVSVNNDDLGENLVEIIAYCIMPTHFHLLLRQLKESGISIFLNKLLISYTRYFNVKYKRKGTLWEGRTKKILVKTDEQLLHLTRYIHLNPTTSYLVNKPEEWLASSYQEYILNTTSNEKICNYDELINMGSIEYKKFVENGILYQREMAKLKNTDAV